LGIVWTAHENSRSTSGCITFSGILHHEMGHLFLHAHLDVSMARTHESYPAYESSEWQANAFAGQLLMPHDTIVDMEIWKIADRFMVSESAAEKQKCRTAHSQSHFRPWNAN
jgi:Zn-dependent peptidase ImmA (M78 family)